LQLSLSPDIGEWTLFLDIASFQDLNEKWLNVTVKKGHESMSFHGKMISPDRDFEFARILVKSSMEPFKDLDGSFSVKYGKDNLWTVVVNATTPWKNLTRVHFEGTHW